MSCRFNRSFGDEVDGHVIDRPIDVCMYAQAREHARTHPPPTRSSRPSRRTTACRGPPSFFTVYTGVCVCVVEGKGPIESINWEDPRTHAIERSVWLYVRRSVKARTNNTALSSPKAFEPNPPEFHANARRPASSCCCVWMCRSDDCEKAWLVAGGKGTAAPRPSSSHRIALAASPNEIERGADARRPLCSCLLAWPLCDAHPSHHTWGGASSADAAFRSLR